MHRKFEIRRFLTAFFVAIFAIVGTIVAIDAPAKAAIDAACAVTSSTVTGSASVDSTVSNGTCYVTFKNTGAVGTRNEITWTKPAGLNYARVLVVGGGGGGGAHVGAGGGAGGLIDQQSVRLSNATYSIKVGQGGRGAFTNPGGDVNQGPNVHSWSTNGADTSFGALYTAAGGGRGASWWNVGPGTGETFADHGNNLAGNGGSGGGAVAQTSTQVLGGSSTQATPGFGFGGGASGSGGVGPGDNGYLTGGGGGAGSAGETASHTAPKKSGDGGIGRSVKWLPTAVANTLSIGQVSNASVFFAGGGGGGMHTYAADTAVGSGGIGGGGAGARPAQATIVNGETITAASGLSSTGGGGGGAGGVSGSNVQSTGGAGGSGVVVISYSASDYLPDDNYMNFNGTSQFASNAGSYVIPQTGSYTIEGWFFENTGTTGRRELFTQGRPSIPNDRFEAYVEGSAGSRTIGMYDWVQNTAAYTVPNSKFPQGEWVHVAFVVTSNGASSTVASYLNGTLITTAKAVAEAPTTDISTDGGFFVGRNSYASENFWSGKIDQVKVWNSALGASAVARSMHAYADQDSTGYISGSAGTPALTNLYPFNEATGTASVADMVGSANLTTTGSPTSSVNYETGTLGGSTFYKFTRSYLNAWGGWVTPSGLPSTSNLLAVAGGGSGGTRHAGGGGAGALTNDSAWPLTAGSVVKMQIGQGGISRPGSGADGAGSSSFSGLQGQGTVVGALELAGGGGGKGGVGSSTTGGSGGGGNSGTGTASAAGAGSGLKNAGNDGASVGNGLGGGGGGGAGSSGKAPSGTTAGAGGDGLEFSLLGSSVCYAAGGGGGIHYPQAGSPLGGPGGDGCANSGTTAGAGSYNSAASSALPNTGSGGGGGGFLYTDQTNQASGAGGSGVVIVSVKINNVITFNANGGTSTLGVQNITVGTAANLSSASGTVTRTGYTFSGWNTQANNYGTPYADGVSLDPVNDITLYAQWIPNAPVLYYNFSDRDSAYQGNTAITNLGSNSAYTGTKIGTLTHDDSTGKLTFPGGTNAAGPHIDVADISTNQFADDGITIDFEADFGAADLWERLIDFGAAAPGSIASNILVGRESTTNNLWVEIYNGATSAGACKVVDGLLNTGFARWTISLDGVNCRIYKDGTPQTTFVTSSNTTTSAWTAKPSTGVSWTSNLIGRSNWTADSNFAGTIRSLRLYAGVLTAAQVGAITYRTINFDANYTGSSTLTSRYTSGRTTLQTAPTRSGYSFGGWYDNIVSASGTLIGGSGAVYSPLSTPMNLYGAWVSNVAAQSPTISSQPANITKSAGEAASFTVAATVTDGGTLSYQWEVSANGGVNWFTVAGGSGAATSSYTTAALVSADLGKQYRVKVTNTLNGGTATVTSSVATLTVGLDKINISFDELNFDFANILHVVGTNGKSLNNKVLFLNVSTKGGTQVDALVTTELLSNATITNYETGTNAGGANSYFQVDATFSVANGFAQFKFDFYKHGVAGAAGNPCTVANPTCTGATKVVLQNVNVSAIDIDYNQWNDFTAAESYTLAGNTQLKECPIPANSANTCTARVTPGSFPADMRFQGSASAARTNDPVDMAIVTYADIETFRIKFGKSNNVNPNYFGVAFKALDWGSTIPQNTGGAAQYTISYNGNTADSGAQAGTHTGAAGATFTALGAGTFVKAGYSFLGWSASSSATTATYSGSSKITMPGSNLTLYAVWAPIKYTLTYDANGGTAAPGVGSYDAATSVTLSSTVPTRAGYVFGGWNTLANGTGTNYASGASYTMPAANTSVYAKWTVANGSLIYNGNNGTTTQATVTAAGGSTTTVATGGNTNRAGYDFVGWNSKADGTGTSYAVGSTFTLVATVNTTVYAQWTLSKYTLVFNVNGGVGTPQSQSYVQGATTTMPVSNPTRSGYTFGGWNSSAAGTGTAYNGSFLMPGNNLTLYAKWNAITYNVTYSNNAATFAGATGTVTDATNYTAAQTVTVAAATGLSKPSFIFIGWNTNAAGTGTDYMPGRTLPMPSANITLYAMWLDASIEIAYNANGGTGAPANVSATLNQPFTISATTPIRSGYVFGGWALQDGSPAGGPFSASGSFTPNTNETLVAQWTASNYTITYNTDGGSTAPTDAGNKHIDDTITVDPSAPTKQGYTFLGWKDADGNIYPAGGSFNMPPNNVVLTAQWQGNAYTLTYDANGGSAAPTSETRNYNAQANLSGSSPTRTGYTFQGWNTLVGGTGTAYNTSAAYTMPNSNTTLFAQWTANSYVLAYNTQGGSTAPANSNQSYGASVTVSASTPTRSGYSFAGWNSAALGTGTTYVQSDVFNMPDANVTLYAQWTKTAFTLYYNTNGGQGVYSSQPVKYTESVTVDSTVPTKTGFTFSGWNTAANVSGFDYSPMSVFTLNVAANVTLYAKWTAVSYTVAYNANTGSGAPVGGSHTFGSTVTTASGASPLALANYRFIGWNDRADGSGTTYVAGGTFSMPAENVILYAQWISSLYQIAYNANGGSGGPDGAIANDGTTYNIDPVQPVRPGYTFGGWKLADTTPTSATLNAGSAPSSFVVAGDELLVAQWTIKTITVTYDLNGGGGSTPNAQSGNYNSDVTLASSSGVIRGNYQFVGWSTTPDGTGTTYVDGTTFKLPTENVILYAKWAPVYYIIEYNPAGGTGEPADQFATPTSTVALATQEPVKAGHEFEKWTEVVQGTNFTPGGSLTMPSNNVLLVANYTVRAAGGPGAGGGSSTGVIDPGAAPLAKPKQLVLSVYFKGDSPVLTTNTKIALKRLAATAKAYGRANNITIYGRVKETNDKSYDLRLSKARAANVAAFLKKYGVTGVYMVYAKGISPENTYKSRRVDMKLWWAK